MRILFIGGTGNISMACTRLAIERGFEVFHLNRGNNKEAPGDVQTFTCDISHKEQVKALLKDMTFDVVANFAEECCDFFLNQRPVIPDDFKVAFSTAIQTSLSVGESLKHAVLCYLRGLCPIEVSRQHTRDIGLVESKVDKLEWDLTRKIFSSELEYSHKIHLKLCLERIVEVSDRAEETADQLELVTLKSMV